MQSGVRAATRWARCARGGLLGSPTVGFSSIAVIAPVSVDLAACVDGVRRLRRGLGELERAAALLELPPLAGREWFELLERKLLPQLHDADFLVVAVVGGTNIGKSVVFNHLAGSRASASSPLASGTKHPVCLVPPGFEDRHDLAAIFAGFELVEWSHENEALRLTDRHLLFWRHSDRVPENLIVLDTPDVDSDAPVNWERADQVRRCADVLLAILTQQKYNDAAVKQFFREAAAEDKAVIVVFNQCQLPDDEPYVALWLETFCRETGVEPEYVYVAPQDRKAAEENRLPFHEVPPEVLADLLQSARETPGAVPTESRIVGEPRDLVQDFSRLRFEEIKLRTLRGSLERVLGAEAGLPRYLDEIRRRSLEYGAAAERLRSEGMIEQRDWPVVPRRALKEATESWWRKRQAGMEVFVHDLYSGIAGLPQWLYRTVKQLSGDEVTDETPMQTYAREEWSAIVAGIAKLYETLERTARDRNDLLRRRLEPILGGKTREALVERLRREHAATDLERELQRLVDAELNLLEEAHPQSFRMKRLTKSIMTYARPVTSAVLFGVGFGPMGEVLMPVLAPLGDVAGGAAATAAGEAMMEGGTRLGETLNRFPALINERFVVARLKWLERMLNEHLLDSLPTDLHAAAMVTESEAFRDVANEAADLRTVLASTLAGVTEPVS
jgi:hypothetical protein